MQLKSFLSHACLAKWLATHLAGHDHPLWHRGVIGITIMVGGVVIAKTIGHSDVHIVAVLGDTVGYGLHGVGLIPFIEALLAEV